MNQQPSRLTSVCKSAEQTGDNELLAKLSMGDMMAQNSKYHSACWISTIARKWVLIQKVSMKG